MRQKYKTNLSEFGSRLRIYSFLFIWLMPPVLIVGARAGGQTDILPPLPKRAMERALQGGETQSYKVKLKAGEYFHVDVVQRGIDVQLALVGADGKVIIERDRPNGIQSPESLSFIATADGEYRLDVMAVEEKTEAGKYEIKGDVPRTPTIQDKKRVDAEILFLEALQSSQTVDAEPLKQSCEKYEAAAALWREIGDKYAEALSQTGLGHSLEGLEKGTQAVTAHGRALTIYKELQDKPDEASSLASLCMLNASLQKNDLALDQYRQARAIYKELKDADGEKDLNEKLDKAATGYLNASRNLSRKQEAESYRVGLRFLAAAREMFYEVGDKKNEIVALVLLGTTHNNLSDTQKALEYFDQALPLAVAAEDKTAEAVILNNFGLIYSRLGNSRKAFEYFNGSLSAARKAQDKPIEARTLINIGELHSKLEDKQKALECFIQALPLSHAGEDKSAEAAIHNNMGAVYNSLGDYQEALKSFEKALPLVKEAGDRRQGEDKRGEMAILVNMGKINNSLSRPQKALELYNKALPLSRELADKSNEATILIGIGRVYDDSGDKQKALEYHSQALPLYKAAGDIDGEATALNNIGGVYDDLRDKQRALEYYNQALPLYKAAGDIDGEANTLSNIMFISKTLRLAVFYGKRSVNSYQRIRSINKDLDKELHKTFIKSIEFAYRYLTSMLDAQGRYAEAVQVLNSFKDQQYFDFNPDTVKKPVPLALTQREAELSSRYDVTGDKVGEIGRQLEELKHIIGKRAPSAEELARRQQLEADLKTATDEFLAAIKQVETEFSGSPDLVKDKPPDVVDTREMQAALRELDIQTKQKAVAVYTLVGENNFRAWIITYNNIIPVIFSAKGKELNGKAKEFLAQLRETKERTSTPKFPKEQVQKTGKELYDFVFAPIAAKLKELNISPDVLMWSLDGGLRYVPVAALYDGRQYLAERYRNIVFTRADSKRMLSHVSRTWTGSGFYNSKDYILSINGELKHFPALVNAKSEVETIFGAPPARGIVKGNFLSDERFTRDSLRESLRLHHPLVHIASHFRLVPGDASSSFLLLGNKDKLTLADIKKEPDSLFGGVELLTLSACETGVQKERESDGREIDSFAELAQRKGAQAILASLWSVEDKSTSRLMMEFYQKRQINKLTKAEALQKAQLSLLKDSDYSHPYYWSPFILIGNWL